MFEQIEIYWWAKTVVASTNKPDPAILPSGLVVAASRVLYPLRNSCRNGTPRACGTSVANVQKYTTNDGTVITSFTDIPAIPVN